MVTKFNRQTLTLLAMKVYHDYAAVIKKKGSVEPESFFENWVKVQLVRNFPKKDIKIIWRIFLDLLFK